MSLINNIKAYKAGLAFYKKNYNKAEKLYENIVSKNNPSDRIILKYAYLEIYLGKKEKCKELLDLIDYDELLNDNEKNEYKQYEGLYLWKNGQIDKAISIYEELHNANENTAIYETLGYLYIVNKDYEKALKYNKIAYDYSDTNNIIIDNLAESYYFLNDVNKAKELYIKIIDENATNPPKFSEAYYYYGMILKKENSIEKAIKMFNKALEMRESYLSILTHETIKAEVSSLIK